jgi:hypothetical protein
MPLAAGLKNRRFAKRPWTGKTCPMPGNRLSLDWIMSRRDLGKLRANKIMADEHGDGTNEGRMLV